jgi:aspartyl-tRNA(Asn)/glutamyl-tRNA(Gln) amidotransferase subunit A
VTSPAYLSLIEARDALASGKLDPLDYVDALLMQIEAHDPRVHAFIHVDGDRARAAAKKSRDDRRREGLPPLFGIPFAVKDNIDIEGLPTTCHSRAGDHAQAGRHAVVVERLVAAGAIPLGKLSLHEYGLGEPGEDDPWPAARNPWNLAFTAGSSSSGCGAALAARLVPLAIGTDTGGSIRSPAMMNGVVGLKPGFGRLSTAGVFPLAPSMDTVGPMARTAADAALAFDCLNASQPASGLLMEPPCIGLLDHLWRKDQVPSIDVITVIEQAVSDLKEQGCAMIERHVAPLATVNAVGWVTLHVEALAIHRQRLKEAPDLYGAALRPLLLTGAFLDMNDYLQAQRLRNDLTALVDHALTGVDCLMTAVSGLPPCRMDDAQALDALSEASVRMMCNVTGHPALALPAGVSADGLPIGLQLIGRKDGERELLDIGQWIEARLSGWSSARLPPILSPCSVAPAGR